MKIEEILGNRKTRQIILDRGRAKSRLVKEGESIKAEAKTVQPISIEEYEESEWRGTDIAGREESYREFFQGQIRDASEGNSYFLTITFTYPERDRAAIRALKHILACMNHCTVGPRWRGHRDRQLRGLVVAEPHKISHTHRGSLHFHLVIRCPGESRLGLEDMKEALSYAIARTKNGKGWPITTMDRVTIESVVSPEALSTYLTKTANDYGWYRLENVCWFIGNDFDEPVIPDQRPIG